MCECGSAGGPRHGSLTVTTIGSAATVTAVVAVSAGRLSITFSPPASGYYTVAPDSGIADGEGLVVAAEGPPLVLTARQYGDLVTGPWWAKASADGMKVVSIETYPT